MVASTAPQASWPSTMIRGVLKMATAYSMLAIVSSLAKLPATRQTNSSATIEGIFGRDARVGAAQDAGVGVLSPDQRFPLILEVVTPGNSVDVPLVALHQ